MARIGEIKQLSSKTYVLDLRDPVRQYLNLIKHEGSVVGQSVVWVRYGRKEGCRVAYPVAVGPTRESVQEARPNE